MNYTDPSGDTVGGGIVVKDATAAAEAAAKYPCWFRTTPYTTPWGDLTAILGLFVDPEVDADISILGAVEGGAEEEGLTLDELAASGEELDPVDTGARLTRAGRAYAKAREIFGPTSGGPASINEAGQSALEEILTNPETIVDTMEGGHFEGGFRFVAPNGIGVVYSPNGTLEYFGRF